MNKICVFDKEKCPLCKEQVNIGDRRCSGCNAEIRFINVNRIKNPNFMRRIVKYDSDGKIDSIYNNVYECYPIDSKEEHKKRTRVIEVCEGLSKIFDGFQWRYADDNSQVNAISSNGAAKSVLQVDFSGKIMAEYQTVGEAKDKLQYTYSTISKACKRRFPPQDAEFFLFFKGDYCNHVFEEAYRKYQETQMKIEVRNGEGQLIGIFTSYEEVAKEFGVSATSISSWCRGIHMPSGEFERYTFLVSGITKEKSKKIKTCDKPEREKCDIATENLYLIETCERLYEKIKALEIEKNSLENKCDKLIVQVNDLDKQYKMRKPRRDSRVSFMLPIEEFIDNNQDKLFAGVCVYVLCDSNGKRYVGQSSKNDYSRIKEHFNGTTKDSVYDAKQKGTEFFVEQIVIGWENNMPFNLDDTEAYFISYYDSYENGYNRTGGNHQDNKGRLDKVFGGENL